MQNMIYDQAVYDILYYDSNLAAYRTDHFGGWQNQPLANGTPFFTYGTLDYTLLTDATAVPSPTPAASVAAVHRAGRHGGARSPHRRPCRRAAAAGDNTALYVGILVVVLVVAGGVLMLRRRPKGPSGEEE